MDNRISPIAAHSGQRVEVTIVKDGCNGRCQVDKRGLVTVRSSTCPVHGHGRPAGSGK